jgi:hypothetical protein
LNVLARGKSRTSVEVEANKGALPASKDEELLVVKNIMMSISHRFVLVALPRSSSPPGGPKLGQDWRASGMCHGIVHNGPMIIYLGSNYQAFSPLNRHGKLEGGNLCNCIGRALEHVTPKGNHLPNEHSQAPLVKQFE